MERFGFSAIKYLKDNNNGIKRELDYNNIPIGIIQTMRAAEEQYKQSYLPQMFEMNKMLIKIAFGYCKILNIFDTSHFLNYSKYECDIFDANHKAEIKKNQFPNDLKKALI